MDIIVTDRESLERGLVVRTQYILVSIRNPNRRRVRVPRSPLCKAAMELAFHDAEPVVGFTPIDEIVYMTTDDARRIWEFVRIHEGEYQAIVVQCEQGMSRSPGVAAALARHFRTNEEIFWSEYQPNQFVYKLMLEAANDAWHDRQITGLGHVESGHFKIRFTCSMCPGRFNLRQSPADSVRQRGPSSRIRDHSHAIL